MLRPVSNEDLGLVVWDQTSARLGQSLSLQGVKATTEEARTFRGRGPKPQSLNPKP